MAPPPPCRRRCCCIAAAKLPHRSLQLTDAPESPLNCTLLLIAGTRPWRTTWLKPSVFLRVVTWHGAAALTLLLHVRPRTLAGGVEVAVYSGVAEEEDAEVVRIGRHGSIFAVQQTQAGLERFAADLVATSPEAWDEDMPFKLELPTEHNVGTAAWDSVQLLLLPPSAVQVSAHEARPSWLCVTVPAAIIAPESAVTAAEVRKRATAYANRQAVLKRQLAQQRRQEAAAAAAAAVAVATSAGAGAGPAPAATTGAAHSSSAGTAGAAVAAAGQPSGAAGTSSGGTTDAPRPQPDSRGKFDQKYRQLRDEAMAQLRAALLAMLRQALRYRGAAEFPGAPPPLPPAAAAADAAGQGAGDEADP